MLKKGVNQTCSILITDPHPPVPFFDFPVVHVPDPVQWRPRLSGQNAQQVLIVFQHTGEAVALTTFLEKVLAAAKLDIQKDTFILTIAPEEAPSFIQLKQQIDFQYFITFGIEPLRMGLAVAAPLYRPFVLDNVQLLFADDLQKIQAEREQGGKQMSGELWRALKTLFL